MPFNDGLCDLRTGYRDRRALGGVVTDGVGVIAEGKIATREGKPEGRKLLLA